MTLELGKVPPGDVGARDAVHVPVVVALAGEQLCGGDSINMDDGLWYRAGSVSGGLVADPFVSVVKQGQKFLACFPPGQVIDVRHDWSHPLLDGPACDSVDWMKRWVRQQGIHGFHDDEIDPYPWWMGQLEEVAAGTRTHITFWGDDWDLRQSLSEGGEWAKVCYHFRRITGKDLDPDEGPQFGCTC